jgi:hypothetical protein
VRVRGVVYDSLLGAPLAGATVLREGEAAVAFTDSAGRFVLDSVPAAPGRFVYSHPGLDSVGLSDVPAAVDLSTARDSVVVRLATPSRTTLAARICGAGAPRGGLAFGEVRDAVAGARLAGARTAVAWTVIDTTVRPFAVRNARRDAVADSSGAWSACGLPIGDALEARAAAGTAESGRAAFALGPRGVARIDLWVALAGETAAATAPTGAPPAGTPPATAPAGTRRPRARRGRHRSARACSSAWCGTRPGRGAAAPSSCSTAWPTARRAPTPTAASASPDCRSARRRPSSAPWATRRSRSRSPSAPPSRRRST